MTTASYPSYYIRDTSSGEHINTFATPSKIASTALVGHEKRFIALPSVRNGQVLATTSRDQTVRLWSLSNPTAESRVLRSHEISRRVITNQVCWHTTTIGQGDARHGYSSR